MNFIKKAFCLVAILATAVISNGQESKITQFQHDSVKFLDNLESYLYTGLAEKSDVKDFVKEFGHVWKLPEYNSYYKKATYRIADEMLAKKLPIYPTFQSFLTVMANFVKSGLSQQKFDQWEVCFQKQINLKPYTNLNLFLSIYGNLFGSGVMYKSPTVTWGSTNSNYEFNCDSIQEIVFNSLDLKCTNERNDTVVIYNTTGVFYPLKGLWKGQGGKTDWTRTGLPAPDVYAELKNYTIAFKEGGFVADSVTFWDNDYFEKPLDGRLVERDITEPKDRESYPRFISYSKRVTIPNLTPDVTYDGGFSMRGRRFDGSGTKEEPAQLIFKRNDKPFLITSSLYYGITKENIMTDDARIIFLLDGDSIYHPDIQMIYNVKKKHVSLIRSTQGLSQAPFFDTYHKVNMFFEELSWYIDQPKMEFRMMEGNTQTVADFESQNFFRPDLYEKLRDPSGISPMLEIAKYSKKVNLRYIALDDMASEMHVTSDELRPILFRLAIIGLVSYDVQSDMMHIEDKLFTYIDNRAGKADYDVLDYHSENPAKYAANDSTANDNGVMDLNTYDISLNGVGKIDVSDSQGVYFFPSRSHMILHRNREATFAGVISAGRFTFFGKQFDFDYADFKIKMKNVDSVTLVANSYTKDEHGNYPIVRVKSTIRHLSGELIIDKPVNKSGLKQFKQYPTLISDTNTFVYYDAKAIQSGVYKKDNFYFKADPFIIDSVNSFSNSRLHFDGMFAASDIVPQMRETLKLQPDYSLGFVHDATADGMDLYKGKGRLYDKLELSNQGLIGDGTLKYVTSVSTSKKFILFPDSMNSYAQAFNVNEQKTQPEFPDVQGDTVYEHWMPYQDILSVNDLAHPFKCYNKFASFHGLLKLTPQLLTGGGRMDFLKAFITSDDFKFLQHRLTSDTANFNLKTYDTTTGFAMKTHNMQTDINFETRTGQFTTNQSGSYVEFPQNQYIVYMDAFKWFMDKDNVELGGNRKNTTQAESADDLQLAGSKFISVAPHQDSLQFISPQALYSLKTYLISAHKVAYIDVADARIFPDSGDVTVYKNAVMKPFTNAKITANKVTKYYDIYKANLTITSRKNYSGSGYYDFIDGLKNKKPMFFSNIHVDTSHQTVANTEIADSAKFAISTNFKYRGSVTLKASNPFLYFDGACHISHSCNELKIAWLKFASEVDPDNIQIPVGLNMKSDVGVPLAASPVISTADSVNIYGAFLSPIVNPKKDFVIVPDSGYLTFDSPSQEYRIASKEKLVAQELPGNYVSFDTRRCVEYGEGNLNLGADLQAVDLKVVGNITDYVIPDTTVCHVAMLVNFFFDDGAMDKMATNAQSMTDLAPGDLTDPDFQKNLKELMSKEDADKLISQLTLYGTVKKLPKELQSQLFLSNVKLKWHKETHSYISEGPIEIGGIGKTLINKQASGVIEIRKKRGGDELNMYIELDPMHWYFFTYFQGLMQVASSNADFTSVIDGLKSDKKEQKTDKGKYSFATAPPTKRTIFLKRIYGN